MTILKVEGINKRYQSGKSFFQALTDVNVEVEKEKLS